ncbi:MAG: hypothetical protein ABF753_09450 [Lentilactobacillus hilgardii]
MISVELFVRLSITGITLINASKGKHNPGNKAGLNAKKGLDLEKEYGRIK